MTARIRLLLALPSAALALAACVPEDGFPSLALRPAERDVSIEEPVHPAVAVPSDPALLTRIAERQRQAAEGERGFEAVLGATETAVDKAGAAESESWVEAQQALSRLEATREPTTRALSDLDRLAIDRAAMPTNSEDFAALNAAIAAVEAIAQGQQQRIDRIRTRLGGP